MRESGYAIKCARCGRTEFVSRKNLDKSGWKDVNVVSSNADEPLDICPICARLFKAMYETFFSSHENGVICYTMDGYPVIFDPDALAYKEVDESRKAEIEQIAKEALESTTTEGVTYTINPRGLISMVEPPSFLNKKFNVPMKKEKDEDEDDE